MSNTNDPLPESPPAVCAGKDHSEILIAIRAGLEESPQTVNLIAASLRSCAGGLRMGQSSPALETLGQAVSNLTLLAELVSGIRTGLARLNLDGAPLASWDACAGTFKGVVDALERRDWVLLSDLIEYELCPALDGTEKEMAALRERLNCIAP